MRCTCKLVSPARLPTNSLPALIAAFLLVALAGCPAAPTAGPAPAAKAPVTPAPSSAAEAVATTTTTAAPESPVDEPAPVLTAPEPFAGWPKPAVAIFLTGQQLGYIEP